MKVKFYRVFNCIFSRSKAANSEAVTVQLLKSYCLPFLLYGSEAVGLSATNMHVGWLSAEERFIDGLINSKEYGVMLKVMAWNVCT